MLPLLSPRGSAVGSGLIRYQHLFEHRFTRVALSLLSAALLICSLPDPDIGWCGWVALVPLIIAIQGLGPRRAAGLGLLFGIASSFGIYGWLFEVPSFDMRHAVVLAVYVGAYPAAWCAAMAWTARLGVPLLLAGPLLWVLSDTLRAHAGFLALPWGTLAQSQHHNLAILQIASLGGEQAVTLLVAAGNVGLACLILRRERQAVLMTGMLLAVAHLWGAALLYSAPVGRSIAVTAIQPDIRVAERTTEEGRRTSLERLERLTRSAAQAQPLLIVWPESAVPGDLQSDSGLVARLERLTTEIGIPLIVGAAQVEKFAKSEPELTIGRRIFNTAYLIEPGEPLGRPYRKRILVPFAEYRPLADIIPWPEWLAPRVPEMTAGDGGQLLRIGEQLSVGPLICWENLFTALARDSVRNGAQMLVQLTNDVWFGRSAAPRQHNLMSVIRAVEHRVPIVIASNTGPSQIIDAYGRIVGPESELFIEDTVTGAIRIGNAGTWYTEIGDSWMYGVFLLAAAGLRRSVEPLKRCADERIVKPTAG
ncbi:MAG: apolipoprotein N-acyltransferase [Nitrospira sp.]|nr:apolipoprotein N-acyltransferase [Nitrospira sp.]